MNGKRAGASFTAHLLCDPLRATVDEAGSCDGLGLTEIVFRYRLYPTDDQKSYREGGCRMDHIDAVHTYLLSVYPCARVRAYTDVIVCPREAASQPCGTLAGTVPAERSGKRRLDVYLEPELYDWIHRQATRQSRSMSGWLRFVIVQLREGLTVAGDAGTVTGAPPTEEPQ